MILILGSPRDSHALAMKNHLESRGAEVVYLDLRDPGELFWDPLQKRGKLAGIPTGEIRRIFFRIAETPVAAKGLLRQEQARAVRDTRRAVEGILAALPQGVVVNPLQVILAHRDKAAQSAVVKSLADTILVPEVLVASDKEALQAFVRQVGALVVKPISGGAFARMLGPRDLQRDQSIRACPMQYQRYIEGDDIRVYVLGEKVFAARILRSSQGVDFRKDPGHVSQPLVLEEDVARCSVRITKALGMLWSGLDLRRTKDGRYFFLEANPCPMFLRFEKDTGYPLLQSLGTLLLSQTLL